METIHSYRLCLGSNAQNGREIIKEATIALRHSFALEATTETIRTPSIGNASCRYYFNTGTSLTTSLTHEQLKAHLKELETRFGRIKGIDLVTLDIDIIMMDNVAIHNDYKKQYVRYLMNRLATQLAHSKSQR